MYSVETFQTVATASKSVLLHNLNLINLFFLCLVKYRKHRIVKLEVKK